MRRLPVAGQRNGPDARSNRRGRETRTAASMLGNDRDTIERAIAELCRRTGGDPRVRVAILDGPVDRAHPAFQEARIEQLNSQSAGAPGRFSSGPAGQHGTHVTSIIVGQRGLAPRCSAVLRPIFSDGPNGQLVPCSVRELSAAIMEAAAAGCQIINVSAGAPLDPELAPTCLAEAVLYCQRQECLLVAAAGNDGCANCLHLPGGMRSPAVLAVGAMNAEGIPLEFSNWGGSYSEQGLLAPGQHIVGAASPDRWEARTGTSYATAVVSGICALLLSLQLEAGQRPRPLAVRAALLATALDCRRQAVPDCSRLLAGRLYLPAAISALNIDKGDSNVSEQSTSPTNAMEPSASDGSSAAGREAASAAVEPRDLASQNRDRASTQDRASTHDRASSREYVATSAATYSSPGDSYSMSRGADGSDAVWPSSLAMSSPAVGLVVPSDCGCGGKASPRQLIYAIGNRLEYDFGTRVRQESLEDNFRAGLLDEQYRSLQFKPNLLRYLLGWDGLTGTGQGDPAGQDPAGLGARGTPVRCQERALGPVSRRLPALCDRSAWSVCRSGL